MKGVIALSGFVTFTILGNYFFKRGAVEIAPLSFSWATLIAAIQSMNVWLGVTIYGTAALFWFTALSFVPLNLAITVSSCIYVLVVLMAFFIFHEPIPPMRWAGIAMIFVGLMTIGRTL